ncbi:signal-induced proliferation-associated 1-like protein 2 isoform X2 [Brachyhypopomus gauderio]|uniref:signal-induced proliferation-associated 1-like protein 2 isoform X2 n=1 Tax=Brachyhypopomus gauderio TaxID=698409 RepID=UPI0040432199
MQTENLFAKKLQALNGNMGPPISNIQGTPVMPKMGVRARVSDWPQRKDSIHSPNPNPLTKYDCLITSFQNGTPSQNADDIINHNEESPANLKNELIQHSPDNSLCLLKKRSNSDVTVSDAGMEDMDQTAINPNTGASLHREYGSTSSVDQQGLSAEKLFTPQRTLANPSEHTEQPSAPPPQGFPEFLCYDTTISPSLQTAANIARGDITCMPNYSDFVDSSLHSRAFLQRQKSDKGDTSIFRRFKTMKTEPKQFTDHDDCSRHGCTLSFQRCFAHYDVQSVLFNISEAVARRRNLARRKNTTGASSGESVEVSPVCENTLPVGGCDDLEQKACTDLDDGDGKSNCMVSSCPYFRNEVGGEGERKLGLVKPNSTPYSSGGENCSIESTLSSHCTNAGVSVLEVPRDNYSSRENYAVPRDCIKRYIIEHIDMGAYYYHKFFYNKEHQNYFGVDENLGPVALSVRREKLDESRDGPQYNYRIIFRTGELTTLRGSILEDAVPSTAKHGTTRGLPLKDILEYAIPELNLQCLRTALSSPTLPEQLLRLDQQGLCYQHKVGVLFCQAGQSTEEEMYNNESGSAAFQEFLDLLGQRVRLKGFTKYRAQLDNTMDSTGTHSVYTTYKNYEIMFHVSTMLPYTPHNRQQLLRKRHIGNDIVTIIFQEPGALPFTPKNIHSHFQHVFIIVKVHDPCTEHVCYSVAVARSMDIPAFGPPIPKEVMFPKSAVFRDFLLTKIINGENAAQKSEKFHAMATRTHQEYLKDLVENFASAVPVDSTGAKFSFITLGSKKKERVRPRVNAHLGSTGAITWAVMAPDCNLSMDVSCLLAISSDFVVLIEESSKEVVFNCSCRDVIGWSLSPAGGKVKLFYDRGDCVVFSVQDGCAEEVREITQRLNMVTRGCETLEMVLRRNALGQLGFHVNFEGVVADVEPFGFAWQAGLRPCSRLVEICKVAVVTLSHEQMIDLLRTSSTVCVVILPPHEDGTPRRSSSELYRFPLMEYKSLGPGAGWHRMTPMPQGLAVSQVPPAQGPEVPRPGQLLLHYAQTAVSHSTSFDKKFQDVSGILQDFELVQSSTGNSSHPYCRSPSNQSTSSDPGPSGTWNQKAAYDGCQSAGLQDQAEEKNPEDHRERGPRLERTSSAEAKWHIPSCKILQGVKQRDSGHDWPSKRPRGKAWQSRCSSHSSSNTLSSNASSCSDDKCFESGDPMDPESLGLTYIKGASTDSGIDTSPCMVPPASPLPLAGVGPSQKLLRDGKGEAELMWPQDYQEVKEREGEMEVFRGRAPAPTGEHVNDGSGGDLSEISSSSSGSHRSGSTSERSSKSSMSPTSTTAGTGLNKHAYSCRLQGRKHLTAWKKVDDGRLLEEQEPLRDSGRLRLTEASQLAGPTESVQTLLQDDSSPQHQLHHAKIPAVGHSPHRFLYRTLSDESLCGGHRRGSSIASSRCSLLDQAVPNDILFSTAAYHSTLPLQTRLSYAASQLKNELWLSDGALVDQTKLAEGVFMPLPDVTSGLDWAHLVDAARTFEDQNAVSVCSLSDGEHITHVLNKTTGDDPAQEEGNASSTLLTGKVNQLELILRQLQCDLRKEQEDKAMLQQQVQHLRQDNLRLHEESQTATAQLQRFTHWILNSMDQKP